eukprot:73333_1
MSDAQNEEKIDGKIPDSLVQYFESNNVDLAILKLIDKIPRFVRTRQPNPITLQELEQEIRIYLSLNSDEAKLIDTSAPLVSKTPLNDFYELDSNIKIAYLESFKNGKIYGMDIASGICCRILAPQSKEHVLDLCCAPGTKLMYIAQLMNQIGSVTGVDISQNRLNIAKKLVRNHRITNVRVFCRDGTSFNEKPDISMGFATDEIHPSCWNQQMIKKKRRKLRKQQRKQNKSNANDIEEEEVLDIPLKHKHIHGGVLYDKVLVDAQCTHDGSVRHLKKYRDEWGWNKLQQNVLNEQNVIETVALQKRLIVNGFDLLKEHGTLVYSTCSLSVKQNEHVVRYLLETFENAVLISVEDDESLKGFQFEKGMLINEKDANTRFDTTKCIRFNPFTSNTSGLFITKIKKSHEIQHALECKTDAKNTNTMSD